MTPPPVSAGYALIARAMEERRLVSCVYRGLERELCPTVLGWSDGREMVLAYQTGGLSSHALAGAQTRWRCLVVADISNLSLGPAAWPPQAPHRQGQSCVRQVDLDINPASPFRPRRKLRWQ